MPPQYTSLFCLASLDINLEVYKFAKQQFHRCIAFRKQLVDRIEELKVEPALILPEYILPYVIHLLAYDEELSGSNPDARRKAEKCIWFTLEPIVQKTNRYAFFMKLLNTIKSTREAVLDTAESTDRLHAMCDVVGKILATKVHQICTEQYKDTILLPKQLYKQGIVQTEESAQFVEEEINSPVLHQVMDMEEAEDSVNGATATSHTNPPEDALSPVTPISEQGTAHANLTDSNNSDSISSPVPTGKKRRRTPSDVLVESLSSSSSSDKSSGTRKSQRKRM